MGSCTIIDRWSVRLTDVYTTQGTSQMQCVVRVAFAGTVKQVMRTQNTWHINCTHNVVKAKRG